MAKDLTHVVRRFQVKTNQDPDPALNEIETMDTGACLSRLNHRLYRQGRNYRMKLDVETTTLPGGATVNIYALAPTWWVIGAWRLAKKSYDDALKDEMKTLSEGNMARWRDFRVAFGVKNVDEGGSLLPEQYRPIAGVGGHEMLPQPYTAGEFNWSRAANLETGTSMKFSWPSNLLDLATEFDILEEFEDSRNESSSPETVMTDMPYQSLASDANADDYVELQANGNEPPYSAIQFENQIWVKVGSLGAASGANISGGYNRSTGFFDAPCGLLLVDQVGVNSGPVKLDVTVQQGDYRGVHAPAM